MADINLDHNGKISGIVEMIDITRELDWRGNKIRVIGTAKKPWFHGANIATALGYTNTNKAIMDNVKSHNKSPGSEIDRGNWQLPLNQYEKRAVFINESGLYSLIMKSKLKEAEVFQDWVTDIVLPSIRQTGGYQINTEIQRLESELANQRLLTNNNEHARKEAEERADALKKIADEERERAEASKKCADIAESENKTLRNAINRALENEKKWSKSMELPPPERGQYMYVATSTIDMLASVFKVGGVGNVSGLRSRLTDYNSSRKSSDPYYYIWFGQCYNYRAIEEIFWTVCERFRDKQDTKKEIVHLRIEHVLNVLQNAIAGTQTTIESYSDQYTEFRRSTVIDVPTVYPQLEIPSTSEKKSKTVKIDASNLPSDDVRSIIVEIINNEIQKTIPSYDFDSHAKTTPAKFIWGDISNKFTDYTNTLIWWRSEILKLVKDTQVKMILRKTKVVPIIITTDQSITQEIDANVQEILNENDDV